VSAVLDDLFAFVVSACGDLPFRDAFALISQYFDLPTLLPRSRYSVLPLLLKLLIQSDGYSFAGSASQLSSLIEILLISKGGLFLPEAVAALYQIVHPFLYQLNDGAIRLCIGMKPFLDPGDLRKFASDLPIVIATFIEKSPQFIAGLARVEVSVVESDLFFQFAAHETFVRGLDLEGDPVFPALDVKWLMVSGVLSVFEVILRFLIREPDSTELFLSEFGRLLACPVHSEHFFDDMAVCVRCAFEIGLRGKLARMVLPDCIFDPAYLVRRVENGSALFAIRYFAVSALLSAAESPECPAPGAVH
jgi:hypothetical protein